MREDLERRMSCLYAVYGLRIADFDRFDARKQSRRSATTAAFVHTGGCAFVVSTYVLSSDLHYTAY
jgi:hypothetical protein